MNAPTFKEFVQGVHGHEPFPWQERLCTAICSGHLPGAVTVPTGLGKTSLLDAWVYALAMSGAERRVPTRLMFVVNRRVIVDGAYEHARVLVNALESSSEPAVRWVADQLAGIGGGTPLEAVRMRGGVAWESRWVRRPDQPAIVCGTVDQFGSRALFRGYGVSEFRRPLDAALVVADALIAVDEAHLSQPLCQTVESIVGFEAEASSPPLPARPTRLLRMTATAGALSAGGEAGGGGAVLAIDDADRAHPVAGARIAAHKSTALIDASGRSKGDLIPELAAVLGQAALDMIGAVGGVAAPGALIVANTIDMARAVHSWLEEQSSVEVELVIGRCRGVERELRQPLWLGRLGAGRNRSEAQKPFVLVATQTVEVGADLDADVLVTEAAPLDSLIQRFGRLDRLGHLSAESGAARAAIVYAKERHGTPEDPRCPVYGAATSRTFETFSDLVASAGGTVHGAAVVKRSRKPAGPGGGSIFTAQVTWPESRLGLGPDEITKRLEAEEVPVTPLLADRLDAPVLLRRAALDWARTSPAPVPDRPITSYLHGPGRGSPQVEVLWRAGLAEHPGRAVGALEMVPPAAGETVSAPLWQAQRFLLSAEADTATDLEAAPDAGTAPPAATLTARCSGLIRRADEWVEFTQGAAAPQLVPGDLVVVDAATGGHDRFGWNPSSVEPVVDVADLAHRRSAAVLRVQHASLESLGVATPEVLAAVDALAVAPADETGAAVESLLAELSSAADRLSEIHARSLCDLIGFLQGASPNEGGSVAAPTLLEISEWTGVGDEPPHRFAMVLTRPFPRSGNAGDAARSTRAMPVGAGDDGDTSSFTSPNAGVLLTAHLGAVADRAEAFARSLGLNDQLVAAVRVAANLHDLGKADRRFQAILRNGDWLKAQICDGGPAMLAKSTGQPPITGSMPLAPEPWPRGMRHEAVSVALIRNAIDNGELPDGVDADLAVHLVATHHGRGRPLFPPVLDDAAIEVTVEHDGVRYMVNGGGDTIDWSQPSRFEALCRRYGPWGLALLETVVRLADIAVSEEGS